MMNITDNELEEMTAGLYFEVMPKVEFKNLDSYRRETVMKLCIEVRIMEALERIVYGKPVF